MNVLQFLNGNKPKKNYVESFSASRLSDTDPIEGEGPGLGPSPVARGPSSGFGNWRNEFSFRLGLSWTRFKRG